MPQYLTQMVHLRPSRCSVNPAQGISLLSPMVGTEPIFLYVTPTMFFKPAMDSAYIHYFPSSLCFNFFLFLLYIQPTFSYHFCMPLYPSGHLQQLQSPGLGAILTTSNTTCSPKHTRSAKSTLCQHHFHGQLIPLPSITPSIQLLIPFKKFGITLEHRDAHRGIDIYSLPGSHLTKPIFILPSELLLQSVPSHPHPSQSTLLLGLLSTAANARHYSTEAYSNNQCINKIQIHERTHCQHLIMNTDCKQGDGVLQSCFFSSQKPSKPRDAAIHKPGSANN